MIMTRVLSEELMNTLACVAISANGGTEVDENGNPTISPKDLELINTYAVEKFIEICNEWEELMGEKWVIKDEKTKPPSPILPKLWRGTHALGSARSRLYRGHCVGRN